MALNLLSDAKLKAIESASTPRKFADGGGLYLLVKPNGARLWRFKYRFDGCERLLALGSYPDVSLRRAREKRDDARRLLDQHQDPTLARRLKKHSDADAKDLTLAAVCEEWFAHYVNERRQSNRSLSAATTERLQWLLYLDAYRAKKGRKAPHVLRSLSTRLIRTIAKDEIASLFGGLKRRNKLETAHRLLNALGRVFGYALGTGRIDVDPIAGFANSTDPRDKLPAVRERHHAALTDPREVGRLLLAIDGYQGQPATLAAFKLSPYLFARPGELRTLKWSELDLTSEHPMWRLSARTKMHKEHLVPLPRQAVAILRELYAITGPEGYVFPAITDSNRPLSENTITAALRRMGYTGDVMTAHGFRTLASTLLREEGWDGDLVERQLNHQIGSETQRAYDKSMLLGKRREMMQAWADYLDRLRRSASVEPYRLPSFAGKTHEIAASAE